MLPRKDARLISDRKEWCLAISEGSSGWCIFRSEESCDVCSGDPLMGINVAVSGGVAPLLPLSSKEGDISMRRRRGEGGSSCNSCTFVCQEETTNTTAKKSVPDTIPWGSFLITWCIIFSLPFIVPSHSMISLLSYLLFAHSMLSRLSHLTVRCFKVTEECLGVNIVSDTKISPRVFWLLYLLSLFSVLLILPTCLPSPFLSPLMVRCWMKVFSFSSFSSF